MNACKKCGAKYEKTNCPICQKARSRAWYLANKERVIAMRDAWRKANPEQYKLTASAYYLANKKLNNEQSAAWRAKNPEKVKASQADYRASHPNRDAEYRKANPDSNRIRCQNRKARIKANGGSLSSLLVEKLFKLQRGKCACGCGKSLGNNYHMDHRMPLALGGANEDWNIQLLYSTCNLQKKDKHPIDFMQSRGFLL